MQWNWPLIQFLVVCELVLFALAIWTVPAERKVYPLFPPRLRRWAETREPILGQGWWPVAFTVVTCSIIGTVTWTLVDYWWPQ